MDLNHTEILTEALSVSLIQTKNDQNSYKVVQNVHMLATPISWPNRKETEQGINRNFQLKRNKSNIKSSETNIRFTV